MADTKLEKTTIKFCKQQRELTTCDKCHVQEWECLANLQDALEEWEMRDED